MCVYFGGKEENFLVYVLLLDGYEWQVIVFNFDRVCFVIKFYDEVGLFVEF